MVLNWATRLTGILKSARPRAWTMNLVAREGETPERTAARLSPKLASIRSCRY